MERLTYLVPGCLVPLVLVGVHNPAHHIPQELQAALGGPQEPQPQAATGGRAAQALALAPW